MANTLEARFLGADLPYGETLALMHKTHEAVVRDAMGHQLLLLEHSPVITITRQHMHRSITTSQHAIESDGIDLVVADRGGDATFHGPGQLVGYPIVKLSQHFYLDGGSVDMERYVRVLEHSLLVALQELGLNNVLTVPGFTGIWYRGFIDGAITLKKLIAIGVGIKDGVSKHGFALNINIDHQRYAKHIIPCGLKDRGVITLHEICAIEKTCAPAYETIVETTAHAIARGFDLHKQNFFAHNEYQIHQ